MTDAQDLERPFREEPVEVPQVEAAVQAEVAPVIPAVNEPSAAAGPESLPEAAANEEPAGETHVAQVPEAKPETPEVAGEAAAVEAADEVSEQDTPTVSAEQPVEEAVAVAAAEPAEAIAAHSIAAGPAPLVRRLWTRVPFYLLGLAWLAFVGGMVYLMWDASIKTLVTSPLYSYFVFGGAALAALGIVVGLIVWLVARANEDAPERGLAGTIWLRTLVWTTFGMLLWWAGTLALDLHRTGLF